MIQLFRALIPSWRFFDGNVDAANLYFRMSDDQTNFSDWILCIPKTGKRTFKNLFLNSRENYLFACHALVEYLKNDLEDQADSTVSLELVKNLVQFQIQASAIKQSSYFQFKISTPEFISAVYKVNE